jgi:hypothetical protein
VTRERRRTETGGPEWARYRALADLLDSAFRVPGTRWRFGLDALLGVVPVAGDLIGLAMAAYGLWVARRLGAPAAVQWRMLGNIAVDALGGAVPVAGDLFDAAFKANLRNRALLERWLAEPRGTERRSVALLIGLPLALLGLVVTTVATAVAAAYFLFVSLSM